MSKRVIITVEVPDWADVSDLAALVERAGEGIEDATVWEWSDFWDDVADGLVGRSHDDTSKRGRVCEGCAHSKYPGIRWPATKDGDDSRPWVERCDTCEVYGSDKEAADVVARGEGSQVVWVRRTKGDATFVSYSPAVSPREAEAS